MKTNETNTNHLTYREEDEAGLPVRKAASSDVEDDKQRRAGRFTQDHPPPPFPSYQQQQQQQQHLPSHAATEEIPAPSSLRRDLSLPSSHPITARRIRWQ
jgi:hypothetical protein